MVVRRDYLMARLGFGFRGAFLFFCLLWTNFSVLGENSTTSDPIFASFIGIPSAGGAPLTVHFTDGSAGNPVAWSWSFGDGSPVNTNQNPSNTFTNAGIYNVILTVEDGFGDFSQTNLLIQVFPVPPLNDNFAHRIPLYGWSNNVTGSNVGATLEAGEPFAAGVPGGESVWWSWTAPASGTVTISTAGSDFDTTLGVVVGGSVTNLVAVAGNDDADPGNSVLTSLVRFDVQSNVVYQISVDGNDTDEVFGSNGVINLSVTLNLRQQAPVWSAVDLEANTILSRSFTGRVLLLDFWQTTCDSCQTEIFALNDLQRKYQGDGLSVIGVNIDGSSVSTAMISSYASSNGITYPILIGNSSIEADFGALTAAGMISVLPTIFIVDRANGVATTVFYNYNSETALEQVIIPLLYQNLRLSISATQEGQVILTWPVTTVGWTLEKTSDPGLDDWAPTGTPVVTNGLVRQTTVPKSTAGAMYFRLKSQ